MPWRPGGVNPDEEIYETYLNKFKNSSLNKLQYLINKSLEDEPELKSRKKIVEVNCLFIEPVAAREARNRGFARNVPALDQI